MTNDENALTILNQNNPDLPAFMQNEAHTGVEDLNDYIVPPQLKIVQKQSDDELLKQFEVGEVIMTPQRVSVAKPEEKFRFVPIFFYAEWVAWNPLQTKGTLPSIRERTTDKDDPLVAKCKNSKLWHEPCPENTEFNVRNCEHLNFVVVCLDGPAVGTPMVMSFARAEHKSGTNLAALIKMRKGPIYGCVFEASTSARSNPKGAWRGFDVSNPTDESISPWVNDENLYLQLQQLHLQYKDAHAAGRVRTEYEETEEATVGDSGEF